MIELKRHLAESQRRQDVSSQEIRSLTDVLQETQRNLKISNEKVNNLSVRFIFLHSCFSLQNIQYHSLQVYPYKFADLRKAHEQLLQETAVKAANITTAGANLKKLQNSYDLLLADFKYVLLNEIQIEVFLTVKFMVKFLFKMQHLARD